MRLVIILLLLAGTAEADWQCKHTPDQIADVIYIVEGGKRAKVAYGILSVKVRNKAHARRVCLRTIRNTYRRWQKAGAKRDYLAFLAKRYAPVGVKNDPHGLNKNWLKNVRKILAKKKGV